MKKFYHLILPAFLFFGSDLKAQCNLSLSTTASTVCAGDNVTLTATATPPLTSNTLNSTLAGGNNHRGNIFDITATNTVTITSFDAHPMGNTTIEIYYRTSPYLGFETSSAGWTLIGSAAVTAQPFGTATPVPVAVNVTIPAGSTYAFYVTSSNTAVSLNYTDGTSEGAAYSSDANITFRQGVGMEYPFTNGTGSVFRPRVWNGVIHYSVPATVTTTYLWNTAATTQTINPTINTSSQYTVQVDVTGCPTMYDTIDIQVSTPPVSAGSDVAVCAGTSVTLSGSGAVSYAWDNSVTNGVSFTPASTLSYTVTGTDTLGCTGTDVVTVTVNSLPLVNAGSDITTCAGSQVTLSGSGAATYTWNNSVTDGVPFTPAATQDYVVTGMDVNNCTASDTVLVTVNSVDATASVTNETITANASGAVYQWINCSNNAAIAGETSQSYTATANGSYAVIVTENGCTDTSACQTITTAGIEMLANEIGMSVYPNPASEKVMIDMGALVADKMIITDATGKVIEEIKPGNTVTEINIVNYKNGVYFIRVVAGDKTGVARMIKY